VTRMLSILLRRRHIIRVMVDVAAHFKCLQATVLSRLAAEFYGRRTSTLEVDFAWRRRLRRSSFVRGRRLSATERFRAPLARVSGTNCRVASSRLRRSRAEFSAVVRRPILSTCAPVCGAGGEVTCAVCRDTFSRFRCCLLTSSR